MDKRNQKRRTPIEWLVARRAETGEEIGTVLNLTICGIQLRSRELIVEADELDLIIGTPVDFDGADEVRVHAICKWSKAAEDGCFDVGMDITEGISMEDLRTVAAVFYRHSA